MPQRYCGGGHRKPSDVSWISSATSGSSETRGEFSAEGKSDGTLRLERSRSRSGALGIGKGPHLFGSLFRMGLFREMPELFQWGFASALFLGWAVPV